MDISNQPLVSVPVITYNSAKFVLETLESIKAQTYQNIELIISDDCSADNTVELCKKWVDENRERFVRTQIITSEVNTGVSANGNRGRDACQGEWIKGMAGDDLLLPNCVQDCMEYVSEHPDTIYLFGRCKAFDADDKRCAEVDNVFDYSFFSKTPDEQLHQLIFAGNCVPATTLFYNREGALKIGVKNDERIPLLEDWPKWINLIRAEVKLHFVDKVLVKYRVGGISTGNRASLKMYRSGRLFDFYYRFPEWYKQNQDEAIRRMVDEECEVYQMLIESESDSETSLRYERNRYKEQYEAYYKWYNQIRSSKAYRLGKALLKPFSWLKKIGRK